VLASGIGEWSSLASTIGRSRHLLACPLPRAVMAPVLLLVGTKTVGDFRSADSMSTGFMHLALKDRVQLVEDCLVAIKR
jgi:hypothetical protein